MVSFKVVNALVFAALVLTATAAVMEASVEPEESVEASPAAVCFPGSATVRVSDGSYKAMSQLSVGDSVEVAHGTYSTVFMFTHQLSAAKATFVELSTASGNKIRLTPSHMLPVNAKYSPAGSAKIGDTLTLDCGCTTKITHVKTVTDVGLYNPQTAHGDIVVNGIRASTYTSDVAPSAAHALLAPFRTCFEKTGLATDLFTHGSQFLANLAPKAN